MKSDKKITSKKGNSTSKIRFYFNLSLLILTLGVAFGCPIYFLVKSGLRSYQLSNESKIIKAVIINEENYVGHSPVEHRFYYSYEFFIDGKSYKGNSKSTRYKIGDSVDVRYSVSNPSFNEITKKIQ